MLGGGIGNVGYGYVDGCEVWNWGGREEEDGYGMRDRGGDVGDGGKMNSMEWEWGIGGWVWG